ncbi:MAG TPA: hypothetical protein VGR61_04960 [Candidatus Dormibacteraeota bacterium]|nr:hypothetical protein [Candidatus Dormibacteraeota bacterium]
MRSHRPGGLAPGAAVPWGLVAIGILLVTGFDVVSATPLHDEWMYRWTLQHLTRTGQLRLWPQLQPLSLVQLTLALPLAAAGVDPRLLRLTTVPLFLVGLVAVDRTARRLGAGRFWSAVAAGCLGCAPLVLQAQTGFLSDGTYLGILALSMWAGVRWLQTGRGLPLFIVLALLGAAQRQVGLLVLAALMLTALRRPRSSTAAVAGLVAALLVGAAGVLTIQQLTGVNSGKLGAIVTGSLQHPPLGAPLGILLAAAPLLGLLALPMGAGLVLVTERRAHSTWRQRALVSVGLFSLLGAIGLAIKAGGGIFPGDTLGQWGLGPIERMNLEGKASPFPVPVYLLIEVAAVAAGSALAVWRIGDWSGIGPGKVPTFVAIVALGQSLPMLVVGVGDRYYIPVFVALLPGIAALASGQVSGPHRGANRELGARLFAVAGLVAGLLVYAAGQADYISWHIARDQAADIARRGIDTMQVDGRDEDFATHIVVPYYDRHGTFPPNLTANGEALLSPRRVVEFAAASDPRPGVTYGTWTRGKVIVRCLPGSPPCPQGVQLGR